MFAILSTLNTYPVLQSVGIQRKAEFHCSWFVLKKIFSHSEIKPFYYEVQLMYTHTHSQSDEKVRTNTNRALAWQALNDAKGHYLAAVSSNRRIAGWETVSGSAPSLHGCTIWQHQRSCVCAQEWGCVWLRVCCTIRPFVSSHHPFSLASLYLCVYVYISAAYMTTEIRWCDSPIETDWVFVIS